MDPNLPATRSAPTPDLLRDKLQEVLSRADYQLDPASRPDDSFGWLFELLKWLIKPLRWLYELTHGLPEFLRWPIVIGLSVVLCVLIAHLCWSFWQAVRVDRRSQFELPHENVSRAVPPEEWEQRANQAAKAGNFIEAIRLLLRACLARLELREKKNFRRGTTNREHLRRYRGTALFDSLELIIQTMERKWYREEPCEQSDLEACRRAYARITQLVEEPARAYSS